MDCAVYEEAGFAVEWCRDVATVGGDDANAVPTCGEVHTRRLGGCEIRDVSGPDHAVGVIHCGGRRVPGVGIAGCCGEAVVEAGHGGKVAGGVVQEVEGRLRGLRLGRYRMWS